MKKIYVILFVFGSHLHAMGQEEITLGRALQQVAQVKKEQYADKLKKKLSRILHFPLDNKEQVFSDLKKWHKGILYKLYCKRSIWAFARSTLEISKVESEFDLDSSL